MKQARIADTSRYYGYDGLNWDMITAELDAIIFCAGIGVTMDYALPDSVEEAKRRNFPYATYHIPSPFAKLGIEIIHQAETYLSWPGVCDALCIADLEPPNVSDGRMVSASEAYQYIRYIDNQTKLAPWWYSNKAYTDRLGWPAFLSDYNLLAAQYYYMPNTAAQFDSFDRFLYYHEARLPTWVEGTIYESTCIGWQFTAHGRIPQIGQRNMSGGIKYDHDFSVSTIPADAFMVRFTGGQVQPPQPPPEEGIMQTWQIVSDGLSVRSAPKNVTGSTVLASLSTGSKVTGTGKFDVRPEWPHQLWVEIKFAGGVAWIAAQYYSDGRILAKTV